MSDFYSYQNKKGYWCARKRTPSGDKHFNSKTKDKRSFEKRAREWYQGLVAEQFGEKPKLTFGDAVEKYAAGHLSALKEKTKERYKGVLFGCLDKWENRTLDSIRAPELAAYESERRAHVKPQTIGFEFKVLSSFFEYCELIELHEGNPVLAFKKKRGRKADIKTRVKRTRYLSHEEERELLSYAAPKWHLRIVFALETGLRKEEQFSLLKSDLDLRGGFINVRAEIAKYGLARRVPITTRARKAIKEMNDMASEFVCPKDDGSRVAQDSAHVNKALQAIAASAGFPKTKELKNGTMRVDLTWHDLRRTCGVRMLRDRGMRMEEVQIQLGHKDLKVTQDSYAFLKEEDVQARLAATERLASAKRRGANGGKGKSVPSK